MITFLMALSLVNASAIIFYLYSKIQHFNRNCVESTGKILELKRKIKTDSDGNKKEVLYATVTFNALLGSNIVEKTISSEDYQVGDTIILFYNPNNIDNVNFLRKQNPLPLLIFGIVFIVISVFLALYNWAEWIEDFHTISEFFYISIALFVLGFIQAWRMIYKKSNQYR